MTTCVGIKTSGSFAVVYALVLVTSAWAQQAKTTTTRRAFVASTDSVKIQYIGAGTGPAMLLYPAGRHRAGYGRSKSLALRRRIASWR